MDNLEVNKAVAAVLIAGIAFMGSGLISEALVHPHLLSKAVIKIDLPDAAGPKVAAAVPEEPIAALLVSADAGRGEAGVKAQGCVSCHSFNEGGKAGVGPNLYGVLGAPHGHMEGYSYSNAIKAKAGPWTYDELNEWLLKPSAYAPGTKMSYAGLTDEHKRADIIAYLRSLSHDPEALPAAPAKTASAAATPVSASTAAPPPGGAAAPAAAAPANDSVALLASASPDAGKTDTLKLGCIACHSFNEGGKAGLGPNLYNVVNGPHAHMEGYSYSAALKAKEGPWTYAELDKWLLKPSTYAPGTKMSFAGIADPKVRADVISYLRSLSADPAPLPATN